MNSRWAAIIAASLVIFAGVVITWQFRHYDGGGEDLHAFVGQSVLLGSQMAGMSNIVEREKQIIPVSSGSRFYDLTLPKEARVFMADMTGPTNLRQDWVFLLDDLLPLPA